MEKNLTHIAGAFLIHADGSFLNGAGIAKGENKNATVVKTFRDLTETVPYVSSQAWKSWLRETYCEECPGEPHTKIVSKGESKKGTTNKIGTEMDPILYAEDDIFGYMDPKTTVMDDEGPEVSREEEEVTAPPSKKKEATQAVMRPATFAASILKSLRRNGWMGMDKGYVHLEKGTPVPYDTQFYNTNLQGIIGIDYSRLGLYRNVGDRIELQESLVKKYLTEGKIEVSEKLPNGTIYRVLNNDRARRVSDILKAFAVMRGGAKQAQFATDVTPKFLIMAGLSSGNLIFNNLFEDTKDGPRLKNVPEGKTVVEEIVGDYADRIVTSVYIGVRSGYLHPESESQIKEIKSAGGINVVVDTPKKAIDRFLLELPS